MHVTQPQIAAEGGGGRWVSRQPCTHPRIWKRQICALAMHMAVARYRMEHEQRHKCEEEDLVGDVEDIEVIQNLQKAHTTSQK